ncbi:hypothetical protein DDZ15_11005 [Rhodohalobacter mucosus]|uniref:LTXXQ motif family protein n=2 Tax=Rhodohalobacter mucosus TaxID=2079485 RepID=A0A316TRU5_9BACT|nr:hypothetical protein DDZ15_11005 [Rhodohalobacter mucosus]
MFKKIGLGIATVLILGTGLFATAAAQGQRGGGQFILTYGEELELTDAQKMQIMELRLDRRAEMQERRRDNRGRAAQQGQRNRPDRPQMRQNMMENRMELRSELLDILNDEQEARLKDILVAEVDERVELVRLRHEVMVEKAGIEGEKARSVLEVMNAQHAIMAGLQKERILSGEPFTSDEMEDIRERRQETRERIKNLLTAAEYEKLQEQMRSNMPQRPAERMQNRRNNR